MDIFIIAIVAQVFGLMMLISTVLLPASAGGSIKQADVPATATATAEAAEACTVRAVITGIGISVGPGADRSVRASMPLDVDVPVIGQFQDQAGNTWYNIQLPKVKTELDRYWVSASDVTASGDCADVPRVGASPIIPAVPTMSYPRQISVVKQFSSSTLGYVVSLPMVIGGFISNNHAKDDGLNPYPTDFYMLHLSQMTILSVNFSAWPKPTSVGNCTLQLRDFVDGGSNPLFNLDVKSGSSASGIDAIIADDYYFTVSLYPDNADCSFYYTLSMTGY